MARRPERTLTIAAALDAVAKYEKAEAAKAIEGEAASIETDLAYTYISPTGKRLGISKQNLTGEVDGWPLPGEYEIDVVDSNGESILDEPWKATEFDKDALLASGKNGDNPVNGLVSSVMDEARIEIRNQRVRIDAAERRESKAREELNAKIDLINDLQRKKNEAELMAGKAVADRDLAIEKQKEAEAALAYQEDQMAAMRPHIQMAVDHGIARFGEMLGGAAEPPPMSSPSDTASLPSEEDQDPAPPGADDPAARMNDLLKAIILDEEMLMELTHRGVITWELARSIYWLVKKKDIGEEPNWDDVFQAEKDPPAAGDA